MSKSLGNLVFVSDLLKTWDPRAIRLAIIEHHYRDSWEWDDDLMPRATARLMAWSDAAGPGTAALDEVRDALDDDLDTPRALRRDRRCRGPRVTVCQPLRPCSAWI